MRTSAQTIAGTLEDQLVFDETTFVVLPTFDRLLRLATYKCTGTYRERARTGTLKTSM
jgi:hypothetical protein